MLVESYDLGRAQAVLLRAVKVVCDIHAASPEAKRFVFHLLGEFSRRDRPLLVFHIGAGTASKTWPVEHWRELVGRAVVEHGNR